MVLEDAWKLEPDFGKRVRVLRTLKGIPQRQMARFGLKQAYMASIEGGTVLSPSREMIDKIAQAFEVSVEELVRGSNLDRMIKKRRKAFCPNNDCPKISLNRYDTGMIIPFRFSIDRIQGGGEEGFEAKFCPYCGTGMISDCPGCRKPIYLEDPQQVHCMNCGQRLFDPITEEMMREKGFR